MGNSVVDKNSMHRLFDCTGNLRPDKILKFAFYVSVGVLHKGLSM